MPTVLDHYTSGMREKMECNSSTNNYTNPGDINICNSQNGQMLFQ